MGEIINLPPREPTEAEREHFQAIADVIAKMWREFQRVSANNQKPEETNNDA
jgi:hypothetical protein